MIKIKIDISKKLSEKYSGFAYFNYDKNIVQEMRNLPTRYYHLDEKCWEIPIKYIEPLKNKFNDIVIEDINGYLDVINTKIELPKNFKFKTKPYKHQIESILFGLNHDKWFLGDQMGCGKTKQAIDLSCIRKQLYNYKHCLIVCGVNTLKWNWVNEINTHSNENCVILGQKTLKNGKTKIGSTKDKIQDLIDLLNDDCNFPYFLITNVESFRSKEFSEYIKKLCDKKIINMCVADEMHKMKNPTSQQTKGFFKCNTECKLGMTGTPLMNNPLDLYVILKWLDCESHSFYAFKNHYCIMGGFGGYEVVGYKNMEQLINQFNEIKLRRLKSELFDLPEKIYIDEYVDMLPKQQQLYKEIQVNIKMNLDNIKFDNNPLSQLIRLRQCTGYTGILSSSITESAKLDRMEDLVEETISNNQKVIIFSNWTQMTDAIYERLFDKQYGIMRITGDTKDNQRQDIVNAFQNTDMCKVLLGTIGAMGTGITLTAATVVIFVDEPWNKALYEQAVDRAHRIGQNKNVTIYNLICKNTIDEKIHNIVYQKGLLSDTIIDGHIIGDKKAVLDYLIG